MNVAAVFAELYGRVGPLARGAVDGLSTDQLAESPAPGANTVGWLIWHLARVQDHHISELLGTGQLWVNGEWGPRFGLDSDPADTGYGHSPAQMAAVRPESATAALEYLDAVEARTDSLLSTLTQDDLDRVVDERWDPPVTLGVRLVSIADDCLQHAGQAAYAHGLITT